MTLYERIAANKHLVYLDILTGNRYRPADFKSLLNTGSERGLALLYVDNSIASIAMLLNFLDSRFAIALLSPQLNTGYKQQLEAIYHPYYIYDPSRQEVSGYSTVLADGATRLFRSETGNDHVIHPDLRLLLSTSGTTGSPRFVKLSDDNLVQNALSIIDYLPITGTDVTPLNLPVFYSYGLSVFTTHSIAGGQVVCTNKDLLQQAFWDDFQHYQFTSIAGVPYVYEMLHRIGFCKKEYPSLRYMTQAGGKLNPVLAKVFGEYAASRNKHFFIMYGQTEATARMAYLPPAVLLDKPGSIGIPVRNGHFEIDPQTQELIYTGPNVFGGYATKAEDLGAFDTGNKLYTGDLATRDEEGYYYITGRLKRFVKLFGTRVNLDEVEGILQLAFGGKTFVCAGVEDKYLLVLHQQVLLEEKTVKQLLVEKLNLHQSAFKVKLVADILLTPNGKVDYSSMLKLQEAG